jgi:hypothetical protein
MLQVHNFNEYWCKYNIRFKKYVQLSEPELANVIFTKKCGQTSEV